MCTSQDITTGLRNAGVDLGAITSIQRRASNQSWVISFCSLVNKEQALAVSSIWVCGVTVTLWDVANEYALVKVYEAPAELPDTVVIGRLSAYGRVVSFRHDRAVTGVENGIRTARVQIQRPIPPVVLIAGKRVRVWYPNQPKLCRKCGGDDHLAGGCTTPRCSNCEKPGHRARACPEPPLCGTSLAADHDIVDCSYLLSSGNVKSGPVFYVEVQSEAVKQERNIQELKQDAERERRDRVVRERELEAELLQHDGERKPREHRDRESCERRSRERKQSRERERWRQSRERERKARGGSRERVARAQSVEGRGLRGRDRSSRSRPTRSPSPYSSDNVEPRPKQ